MSIGARFYRSDFQVHTPRDINFLGRVCTTEEARIEYSRSFIKACRDRKLDAVAITDHHDLGFYNYIKNASIDEKDSSGNPIPENKRIIVFPGIELTLDVPCQALLIFDSTLEITDDVRIQIYTALKISNYTSPTDNKTAPTIRLPFKTINEVYEALDGISSLKGRFIVLPNIKEGGSDSILREGFYNLYANGIFVGGYLDRGLYESHSKKIGWNNIISGKVEVYGDKSVGILQTSDNRTDTFEHLGISSTWIKWSEPTAEGIRQACLAKTSRIFQVEPKIPNNWICSININNSSYLGNMSVYLNPQFNVIIGGRGTGKSCLLQYISWGLGKDYDKKDTHELTNFINNTLSNGSLTLNIIVNGVSHEIERSISACRIKVGNSDWRDENPRNLSTLIKSESFGQKELSRHEKIKTDQITHLIEYSIHDKLQELKAKQLENESSIKETFTVYEAYRSNVSRCSDLTSNAESLKQQLSKLTEGLKEVPESDLEIIKKKDLIENERRIIESNESKLASFIDEVNTLMEHEFLNKIEYNEENVENNKAIQLYINSNNENKNRIIEILTNIVKNLQTDEAKSALGAAHEQYNKIYNEAIANQKHIESELKVISALQLQLKAYNTEIDYLSGEIRKQKQVNRKLFMLYQERNLLNNKFHRLIFEAKNELESKSNCSLKIKLSEMDNVSHIISEFDSRVTGSKGQLDRTKAHFNQIKSKNNTYKKLLKYWFVLMMEKQDMITDGDSKLQAYGINNDNFRDTDYHRIEESLSLNDLVELSLLLPTYSLELMFCKDAVTEIPFEDASYGQQAGTILTILLNQASGPLIIDQPEDDLDNKVIHNITDSIILAKHNRQLIFSSHNANIAVNGDADLIMCFEHNSSISMGEIAVKGSIDEENVKIAIKEIMEGGEKAFAMRKAKYGF